jgi:uncharacterized protein (TIGR02001 family)
MKKSLIALALVSAFAAPAFAEEAAAPASPLSFNVGVVTDYVFRGISQSQHKPALQAGVDYAHESGLYVGAWGSTIEWVDRSDITYKKDNNFEVDLYGGYKGAIGDFTYDLGLIRYFYPGKYQANSANNLAAVGPDTTEAYLAVGWKIVSLKYSEALTSFIGWGDTQNLKSKGSNYTDLTVTYPIDETLNVIAHVGRQNVTNNSVLGNYTDYKLGVTKDVGFGVVGLAYTDTNAKHNSLNNDYLWSGKNAAKGVLAASFVKTF